MSRALNFSIDIASEWIAGWRRRTRDARECVFGGVPRQSSGLGSLLLPALGNENSVYGSVAVILVNRGGSPLTTRRRAQRE